MALRFGVGHISMTLTSGLAPALALNIRNCSTFHKKSVLFNDPDAKRIKEAQVRRLISIARRTGCFHNPSQPLQDS
jgi:hypothetical protein